MAFEVTTYRKVVIVRFNNVLDLETADRLKRLIESGIGDRGVVLNAERAVFANDAALMNLLDFCESLDGGRQVVLCNLSDELIEKVKRLRPVTRVSYTHNLVMAVAHLAPRVKKKQRTHRVRRSSTR